MLTALLLTVCFNCQVSDTNLIPFPTIPGNFINKDKNYTEIRKYNLIKKVDTLIYKDKIIAYPDSGYFSNIYEMFKGKYIIVTPTTEETKYYSTIYQLPKNKIKIIPLDNPDTIYEVNLNGKQILDIDIKNKLILVKQTETGDTEFLKLKRVK